MEPVTLTLIGTVAALVGVCVHIIGEDRKDHQRKIESLKTYMRNLADCVCSMYEKLRNNEVPTEAGNRLETAVRSFCH